MSRKPTLCKQSAAVVAHLKQHGAATLDELLPHFADEGRSKLRKRLSNLVDGNWLDIAWDARGAIGMIQPRSAISSLQNEFVPGVIGLLVILRSPFQALPRQPLSRV